VALYCLCRENADREPDKGNRLTVTTNAAGQEEPAHVTIYNRMTMTHVGVEQALASGHRHYPNVDIFECPACGRRIVRE
jgi:hypothetical protein